jgi:ribosomal protein S18 acetylase RimI-like enzyme
MILKWITVADDLQKIADLIVDSEWGEDNEIETSYSAVGLKNYLSDPRNILLIAYEKSSIAGMVTGTIIQHPAAKEWLYVDEVDVAPPFRKRGIGRAMMLEVLAYTRKNSMNEVWLGTEADNLPANKLYSSLSPSETEQLVGYTFEF